MATRTQIYREVMREYDALRAEKAAQMRQRREAVYRRLPRVKEIEDALAMLGIQTAKLVLASPGDIMAATANMQAEQKALQTERQQLLEGAGLTPQMLEMEYACSACQDTGYVGNTPCNCLKRRIMDKMYDQSNIRRIVQVENFDSFDLRLYSDRVSKKEGISPRENATNILRQGLAFVERFGEESGNLLLYGPTGLGKTFLCSCIAKELLDKGYVVLYLTAGQLFRKLEEIRFSKEEDQEQEDWDKELLEADLLIIDDLGTEFSTLFTTSELFRLLNDRKLSGKSVMISTNLNPEEITNQYSDRITSRLREYRVLQFFGEDIRLVKKFRRRGLQWKMNCSGYQGLVQRWQHICMRKGSIILQTCGERIRRKFMPRTVRQKESSWIAARCMFGGWQSIMPNITSGRKRNCGGGTGRIMCIRKKQNREIIREFVQSDRR